MCVGPPLGLGLGAWAADSWLQGFSLGAWVILLNRVLLEHTVKLTHGTCLTGCKVILEYAKPLLAIGDQRYNLRFSANFNLRWMPLSSVHLRWILVGLNLDKTQPSLQLVFDTSASRMDILGLIPHLVTENIWPSFDQKQSILRKTW